MEKEQSLFVDVFMLTIIMFVVVLGGLFLKMCWQGFDTSQRIKEAQEQALEHTIKMNECKLTGYYKRSSNRMFICADGNTYKEDRDNLMLVRVQ